MNPWSRFNTLFLAGSATFILVCSGCSQEDAAKKLSEAEEAAEKAADTIAKDTDKAMQKGEEIASEAVKEGKELAGELGEKAMAFLTPLKEKFGNLESLKESPEKLKQAATELIASIEQKAEGITLPETVSNTLNSVKEQLVALKEYLEGEYEQAKINDHIQEIMDSVRTGLGMTES